MTYGITPEGFVKKDTQTIITELETAFKATYGEDLDVDPDSLTGQLIGNLAEKFSNIWELLEAVYASFNPDSASGVSLDGASALVGVERLEPLATEVYVTLYGDAATIILEGHVVRQAESNLEFSLTNSSVTIDASAASDARIDVTADPSASEVFTVTINSIAYSYTAMGGDTKLDVVTQLVSEITGGSDETISAEVVGTETLRVFSISGGRVPFSFSISALLEIQEFGSPGLYVCEQDGANAVPVSTIQEILTPVVGLDRVENIIAGVTGRALEEDDDLRIRRRNSLQGIGYATDEAMRARLLQEVEGVTFALVISNRTDVTDGDGRPPHSFESVVVGGDDEDIANTIWTYQANGIPSYGSTTVVVKDSTGRDQTIKFSRPSDIYIWFDLEVTEYTEEDLPTNYQELIKAAMVDFAASTQTVGVDLLYQRYAIPIYTVPGIAEVTIEVATSATPSGPPGAYASVNIPIADNEIADVAEDRITVALL